MIKTFNKFLNENYIPLYENANQVAAQRTEIQEEITCSLFNAAFNKKYNYKEGNDFSNFVDNELKKNNLFTNTYLNDLFIEIKEDQSYRKSFTYQLASFAKWCKDKEINPGKYIYVRYDSKIDTENAKNVTERIKAGLKEAKKGIARFAKDNYMKADIFAIDREFIKNEYTINNNIDDEIAYWADQFINGNPTIFGISLKKLSTIVTPKEINSGNNIKVSNIDFVEPTEKSKGGYITFNLIQKDDKGVETSIPKNFSVRDKTKTGNVSIELNGNGTRDGNVKTAYNILTKNSSDDIEDNELKKYDKNNKFDSLKDTNSFIDILKVFYKIENCCEINGETLTSDQAILLLYKAAKGYQQDLYKSLPYLYLGE